MRILSTIWCMLFILVYLQEKYYTLAGCLTWDLNRGQLTLICRLPTNASPVAIFDNKGEIIANCSSQGEDSNCQSFRGDEIVAVNISTTEMNVTLQRSHITHYHGQWICQHKTTVYRADVSSDMIKDTTVELEVVTTTKDTSNHQNVELICSSCRIPFGFNAEFLIHNSSIDSVTYDPSSSTCYHGSGVCSPQICDCRSPGNHFSRMLRVDMSIPKLFSCDMIFVDTHTTAKFSKTSGIYLDGQGFHSIRTITRIIKPGKPIDITTDKSTNQDLSTVSSNKYSTTKSTSTETNVTVELLVGLTLGGVITICLLLALLYHCLHMRKMPEKKFIHFEEDGWSQCHDTHSLELTEETPLVNPEGETYGNKKRWMLAGILSQIANKDLTLHMKDKMSNLYQKLKREHSIDEQDHSNFLETFNENVLNYKAVNENYKEGLDEMKYDYMIRNAEALTVLFLPCSLTEYGKFNEDTIMTFGELLDIFMKADIEMTQTVKTDVLKIQADLTDWFSNDDWTEEKFSLHIKRVQRIAAYTGKSEQSDIRLLEDAAVFDNQDFISKKAEELYWFVKQTEKSLTCCNHRRMFALLKDNKAYNEFLKKKRLEEKNLFRLTKLVMEIGMTVIKQYITLHVLRPLNADFKSFLDDNKHQLFHAWHNKKRCCQCKSDSDQKDQCDLTREQYRSLFLLEDESNDKEADQSPHQDNSAYCICNIVAKRDVTLDAIDCTIALCIMMHCTSTKALTGKKEIIKCTQRIRNCRNSIFPMVTSCEMPLDIYNATWKETEKSIIALSACMDDKFNDKIRKDIQSLKSNKLRDEHVELAKGLKQCEEDIKLSRNQQLEKSFLTKLNESKSSTRRSADNLTDKDQLKDLEWRSFKRNGVLLKIKSYPIDIGDNIPVHEVLIKVDAPKEWNIDEILETVRNKAPSISQICSVYIIETTLEAFHMIVEIDAIFHQERRLHTEIEKFFWGLLETCHVDFSREAILEITMKLLKTKPNFSFKYALTTTGVTSKKNAVVAQEHKNIAELKLMIKQKIETEKDPFFTSAEVWSDDEFVFIEKNNSSLIIYNFKTESKRVIRLSSMPFSMAVMEDGKIAMSFPDKQEIRISLVVNKKLNDVDSIQVDGKCYTLTKKNSETVIVSIEEMGIYSCNIRYKKLEKLKIQIPDFVPKSDELFYRAGRLFHTCRANGSLHCYEVNGKHLWTVSGVLQRPTTITSDEFGNVFATDFLSSKLYHIFPDGKSNNILLSSKNSLHLPTCLYFCEKRNWLLIVNRDNGMIFCYEVFYK